MCAADGNSVLLCLSCTHHNSVSVSESESGVSFVLDPPQFSELVPPQPSPLHPCARARQVPKMTVPRGMVRCEACRTT